MFQYWEDVDGGGIFAFENPYTFVIDTSLRLKALFQIPVAYYNIRVISEQPDMGRVSVAGGAFIGTDSEGYSMYQVADGNQARLSAVANTNYRFVRWSDGTATAQYNFIVHQDVTLSASFEENPIIPQAGSVLQLQSTTGEVNVGLTGTLVGDLPVSEQTYTREYY